MDLTRDIVELTPSPETVDGSYDDTDARAPRHPGEREEARESLPQRGDQVGRYVVLDEIGAGAMGVVYAAFDPELDRKVALKVLRQRGRDWASAQARLVREAQALARLSHPNVVAVYDVGPHESSVFIAMEFIDGRTLKNWLVERRQRGTRWPDLLPTLIAAGRGLEAAHRQGLVHRDFKPDNVMVQRDGRVVVMDFGLARAGAGASGGTLPIFPAERLDRDEGATADDIRTSPIAWLEARGLPAAESGRSTGTTITRVGAILGTPAYMAPEQFLALDLSPKTDQFSFCVVLYEAIYGERPFDASDIVSLSTAVCEGRIRTRQAGVIPRWLERTILRGLSTSAESRFANMGELLGQLMTADRRRTRGRILVVLATVGCVAAGVFSWQSVDEWSKRRHCEETAAGDRALWTSTSSKEGSGVGTISERESLIARINPWLDAQAEDLSFASRSLCLAIDLGEAVELESSGPPPSEQVLDGRERSGARDFTRLSGAMIDKARWCLDDRRLELRKLATRSEETDLAGLRELVESVAQLAPVQPCIDARSLALSPPPPPESTWEQLASLREALAEIEVRRAAGEYQPALEMTDAAVDLAKGLGWDPLHARALYLKGSLLESIGRPQDALAVTSLAYEIAASAQDWELASAAALEAVIALGPGLSRYDEAEAWALHAKVAIAQTRDPLGVREFDRLLQLGQVKLERGETAAALALGQQMLALSSGTIGADHPRIGFAHTLMGRALASAGDLDGARVQHERAAAMALEHFGPDHPAVAIVYQNLGLVLTWMNDTEQAIAVMLEAKRIYARTAGGKSRRVYEVLTNLGRAYQRAGKDQEARAALLEAKSILEQIDDVTLEERSAFAAELASSDLQAGRVQDALESTRAVLSQLEGSDVPLYPTRFAVLLTHGDAAASAGQHAAAITTFEEAVRIGIDAVGPDHFNVGVARASLADVCLQIGDRERARTEFELALAIFVKAVGDDHPDLASIQIGLGELALAEHRYGDAFTLLERAYELRTKNEVSAADRASAAIALATALMDAPTTQGRDHARGRTLLQAAEIDSDWTLATPEALATRHRLRAAAGLQPPAPTTDSTTD